MNESSSAASEIRTVLEAWAAATRENKKDEILKNHADDCLIYDVLQPMQYEGAESYRRSWDQWQPETQGEAIFNLENLVIAAGNDVAFAHGLIRCGGTTPDGHKFRDLVRSTFCLRKVAGSWLIQHQHVSKPVIPSGN